MIVRKDLGIWVAAGVWEDASSVASIRPGDICNTQAPFLLFYIALSL